MVVPCLVCVKFDSVSWSETHGMRFIVADRNILLFDTEEVEQFHWSRVVVFGWWQLAGRSVFVPIGNVHPFLTSRGAEHASQISLGTVQA